MSESGGGFNIIAYVSAGLFLRVRTLHHVSRKLVAYFSGSIFSLSLLRLHIGFHQQFVGRTDVL